MSQRRKWPIWLLLMTTLGYSSSEWIDFATYSIPPVPCTEVRMRNALTDYYYDRTDRDNNVSLKSRATFTSAKYESVDCWGNLFVYGGTDAESLCLTSYGRDGRKGGSGDSTDLRMCVSLVNGTFSSSR